MLNIILLRLSGSCKLFPAGFTAVILSGPREFFFLPTDPNNRAHYNLLVSTILKIQSVLWATDHEVSLITSTNFPIKPLLFGSPNLSDTSYRGFCPKNKAAVAYSRPLTSIKCQYLECFASSPPMHLHGA